MKYISVREARKLDKFSQDELGISGLILMENAGREAAEIACCMLSAKRKYVIFLCGKGNNAGDGFVCARHLITKKISLSVFMVEDPSVLKGDALTNYLILKKMKAKIYSLKDNPSGNFFRRKLKNASLIIDALFGIGLSGEVNEPYRTVIDLINIARRPVLSLDVPSGLDADSGKPLGICIKATRTVTFILPKKGFIRNKGPLYTGQVIVRNISAPGNCPGK
ncbi:MAG: NAD(P)H-hydrate epimerase [Candidatus Omnitrophica bacterium]|nr:NAD(P)H-hydrate epimerase [Candidatus Omnitrophota bacterium]